MQLGITRMVWLVGKYAIKIANPIYNHEHFLDGCRANWSERNYYKSFINADYAENMVAHVAPSLFCSWFGLLQIQRRCIPLEKELNEKQKEFFKPLCRQDNKKENFGWYNGKIVCLDYP